MSEFLLDYSPAKTKKTLVVLFVGVLMAAMDISIVGPALPAIQNGLNIHDNSISWVFSIFVLFNLLGISMMSKFSDIYGRRIIYVISILIFTLGSIIVALSNSIEVLLLGRAIQGFGSSGVLPVASAVIGDIYPADKRGRVLGLVGMMFGIAFIIGPIVAGVLLKWFSWKMLFLINIPISIYLIIGAWKYLPHKKIADKVDIDWLGILFLGLFLALFTYGFNSLNLRNLAVSLTDLTHISLFAIAFLFFIAFIWQEKRHSFPIMELSLFTRLQVKAISVIAFGTGILQASFIFVPKMAVAVFGLSPSKASFMLIPLVITTAIGAPISGRMLDKIGSKIVVLIGTACLFLGLFTISFFVDNTYVFYVAGAFIGFGQSFLMGSSLRYMILNEAPAEQRASSLGMLSIFTSVGQILGSTWLGVILAGDLMPNKEFSEAFFSISFVALLLVVTSLILKNKSQEIVRAK